MKSNDEDYSMTMDEHYFDVDYDDVQLSPSILDDEDEEAAEKFGYNR